MNQLAVQLNKLQNRNLSPALNSEMRSILLFMERLEKHIDISKIVFVNKDIITGDYIAAQAKAIRDAAAAAGDTTGGSSPGGGGGGGSTKPKQWLKDAKKETKDLEKYNRLISKNATAANIEAISMIPQEQYLKMSNKQRKAEIGRAHV